MPLTFFNLTSLVVASEFPKLGIALRWFAW